MPRRAFVITLVALFSLGLLSIRPAFSETPKAADPLTAEEAAAFKKEIEQIYNLAQQEAQKASDAAEDAEKEVKRAKEYTNMMTFITTSVLVLVGILGGIFIGIRIVRIQEMTREARGLRDECEEHRKRALAIIQELEKRLEEVGGSS